MNWIFLLTLLHISLALQSRDLNLQSKSHYFPCMQWKWAYGGNVPGKSFVAGKDSEDSPIYLARIIDDSKFYLGTVLPRRNLALFLKAGKVKQQHNYQVLTKVEGFWQQVGNRIPAGALEVAQNSLSKPLYIGRTCQSKTHIFGLISKAHAPNNFAFNKEVVKKQKYQVLVSNWQDSSAANYHNAFEVSHNSHIYIGRAKYGSFVIPGIVINKTLYIAQEGKIKQYSRFELLMSKYYKWRKVNGIYLPSSSVQAGVDLEYHSVHICKHTLKGGKIVIGKVANDHLMVCYYALNGYEYATMTFEVLVHDPQPVGRCTT